MNKEKLSKYIKENAHLFWWTPDNRKENISVDALVEQILNYGDETGVKKLFEIVGQENVARIFFSQISGRRCNYFPQVINFFTLYFNRHNAQRNTFKQSY